MSNLLVLVAGTTLDYCVKVLLMGSLFPPFFGQEVTHIHTHTHTHTHTHPDQHLSLLVEHWRVF